MTTLRIPLALALLLSFSGFSRPARAWDASELQYAPADGQPPGGGGIIGTGSRTDNATECSHCHIDAEQKIDLTFAPSPAFDTVGDALFYEPERQYEFTVTMTGEHLGLSNCPQGGMNGNMMAATFEDASGADVGVLESDSGQTQGTSCPASTPDPKSITSGTTLLAVDCRVVLTRDARDPGATSWTFRWTAPPAGAGEVTLFGGGVDSNCDMSSLGDDVKMVKLTLSEGQKKALVPPQVQLARPPSLPLSEGGTRPSPAVPFLAALATAALLSWLGSRRKRVA